MKKKTRVIAFCNQKGGVGKTTTCFNVGRALSLCGFNVLLIDADPQGDLTTMSGHEITDDDLTLYDVLHKEDINKAIQTGEAVSVIPSDETLSRAEIDLLKAPRTLFKDALGRIETDFDFILIDCPPSLNVLTINALTSATEIIIPVQSQYLALKGVARLKETIAKTKETLNPDLKVGGVVVTFYDGRRNLDQQVRESLERSFGAKVYKTTISINTKVAEAPSFGLSIFDYAPRSRGASQYKELTAEIVGNMKPKKRKERS